MKNKSFKDARSFSKNPIAAAALILLTGHAQAASGLPDIGKNKLPDGISIDQSQADKLIITQGVAGGPTMNSQIDWDTFRVGDQMQVRFDQPNASSVILNRVVGGQVSDILGSIQANGRIFLINPQGITFGVNSQVNVGSFVASTLGLSEKETSKDLGQIVLNGQPKGSTGILQQGSINANQIALIGATVTNTGSLTAGTGEAGQVPKVYLIAAQKVTADTTGDYIVLTPEAGAEQALLQSLGSIDAGNGTITLIAKSDGGGGASVLNLQGIMKAGTLHTSDSGISLQADQIQQTVVDGESVKPLQATGSLDIQANQIDLGNAGNQISGDVSVVSASNVTLQSTSGLSVNRIQAAGDVDLVSGADLGLSGNLNVGGSLAVTAVGQLTEANGAAVTVTGSSTLKAKSVSLDQAGNDFQGAVTSSSTEGDTTLVDKNDLAIGGSKSVRNLNVTAGGNLAVGDLSVNGDSTLASGGQLTQAQGSIVTVKGATDLNAQSITLGQSGNDFLGVVASNSKTGDTTLVDKNDLAIGGSKSARNLNVTAGGNLALGDVSSTSDVTLASGGQMTQTQGSTVTVKGASNLNAKAISLDQSGNDFQGVVVSSSTKGGTTLVDKNDLSLNKVDSADNLNVTAGGNLALGDVSSTGDVTLASGGQMTQAQDSALNVKGATDLNAQSITLGQSGNDFQGAVTSSSTGGSTTFVDKNDLSLNKVDSAGNLNVTAGGNLSLGNVSSTKGDLNAVAGEALSEIKDSVVTVMGSSSLKAKSVSLDQAGNDFQGAVTSSSTQGSTTLVDKNDLVLSKADSAVNLNVTAGGNLALGDVSSNGDLNAVAGEALSEIKDSAVTVAGSSKLNAKTITLDQSGNDFQGAVSSTSESGNTTLVDKNDLALNNVNSKGNLKLTSGGQITQVQGSAVIVSGASSMTAKSVTLGQTGNDFQGAVASSSTEGSTTLVDKNDLALNKANSAGNLNVTAGGNLALGNVNSGGGLNAVAGDALSEIKDSAITVAGSSNLNAKSISLDQAGNDFQGAVASSSTAGNTTLVDKNDLALNKAESAGNLNVTAGGNLALGNVSTNGDLNTVAGEALSEIKDSAITVAGSTSLNAQSITLGQSGNDFQGAVTAGSNAGSTALVDKNDLTLNTADSAGNLNVTAGGNLVLGNVNSTGDLNTVAGETLSEIKDSAITVAGSTNLNAKSISLDQSGNDFQGAVTSSSTSGDTTLADKNDLALNTADSAGSLNVTAGGNLALGNVNSTGNVMLASSGQMTQTQGSTVTVKGATDLNAQSITLGQSGNDFQGTVTSSSTEGNTSLNDKNDLALNTADSAGNLNVTAGGNLALGNVNSAGGLNAVAGDALSEIKDSAITVAGSSNLNAKSISLDQSGNDFQGAVVSSATEGSTTLVDKNDLVLSKADSAVNLNVTAGGNLALGDVSSNGDLNAVAGEVLSEIKDSTITVAGSSKLNAKTITLDQSGNDFQGAVASSSTAGNTTLIDKNDLSLNKADSAGNLNVSAGGNLALGNVNSAGGLNAVAGDALSEIKDSAVTVSGSTNLNAKSIGLDQSGNDFQGAVVSSSTEGGTTLVDKNDLALNKAESAGNLNVTAGGNLALGNVSTNGDLNTVAGEALSEIKDSAITVAGSTSLNAQSITLGQSGNDFQGAVTAGSNAGSTALVDKNDLTLNTADSAGNLNVTAGGNLVLGNVNSTGDLNTVAGETLSEIKDSAITVAGSTNLNAKSISLDQSGNDFQGAVTSSSTSGDTTLADKNDLALNTADSAGSLNVTAGGNLALGNVNSTGNVMLASSGQMTQTQGSTVTVKGATDLNAQSITLGQSGNDFQGTVTSSSTEGNTSLNDKNDLALNNVSSKGDLNAVAGEALSEIKDSAITVAGSSYLNAKSISLDQAGNDFQGAVTSSSTQGGTTLVDKNDLALNKVDSAGNLNATAGGNLALGNVSSAGDLALASGAQLTQAQGSALTVNGASALNAKAITLDQSGNDFQSTVNSTSTNGPTSLTDKNDLTLGNVNDAGDLTLTAAGKLLEQQDAAISVAGVAHLQADAISLAQANNQLSGAVHANSASGGTSIKTQGDLQLGNVNSSGALDLSAGGNLTQANNTAVNALGGASIHAKSIDLRQAGNDFSGGVSLNTSAGDVSLFDKNDFNFASGHTNGDLSVQALGQVTEQSGAALVVTGNSNLFGNTVNVGELTNDFGGAVSASAGSGKVTIGDTNDLVIGSGHVAGDLDVHANGNVTQANGAAMSVGGATSLTAASIALDQPDNHFSGAVTANSSQGLISLSDDHDLTLGNVKSAGDLSIRAKGNLLQEDKASVVAQGLTDLHAKAVNLIQSNNDFGKAVSVSTSLGDAAIYDSNDLQLGSGSIQGQFTAHAAGAITQASGGALNVSGKTALQAQSVSVNQTGNDFKDVVNVIGTPNSVALADKNDLLIGDLHTTGNATLNALGHLAQATSTSLQVQGDTTVSGGTVVLDHAENQLLGSVSAQSTNGPVVVDNAAPLLLGNVSSAGNLTLETQGDLNQVVGSSVKAAGTTTLTASKISLAESGNDFQGSVASTSTAGLTNLTDKNDLLLGNVSSSGNLTISAGGALSETKDSAVTVAGSTNLNAKSISLDQAGNDFQGTVASSSTAGRITLVDKNDLVLSNANSAGNLNVTAGGNLALGNVSTNGDLNTVAGEALSEIKDSAITVAGSSKLNAKSITLDQSGNDFQGAVVSSSTEGGTTLADKNDLSLNKANSAGNLIATAGRNLALGNVNSTGDLNTVAGETLSEIKDSTITVAGSSKLNAKTITLDQSDNDFQGAVVSSATAGSTTLVDKNDLALNNADSAGNLNVTAGGNLSVGDLSVNGDSMLASGGQMTQAQGSTVTVKGATDLNAQSITLGQSGNDFQGAVTSSSTESSTTLVDKNDLVLNKADSAGNLNATAGGNLSMGNVSSTGDVTLASGGQMTQTQGSALTVKGATDLNAQSITLGQSGNDFQGAVTSSSTVGDTTLVDKNDLSLNKADSAGNLNVTAGGNLVLGNVSSAGDLALASGAQLTQAQGSALTVNGASVLNAKAITLGQSGNDFQGAVTSSSTAGSTTLVDQNDLALNKADSAGNLNVTAGGNLTLGNVNSTGGLNAVVGEALSEIKDSAITVAGSSTLNAKTITLDQSGNDFQGTVTSSSTAGSTTLVDKNDLVLNKAGSAGNLNATAGGNLALGNVSTNGDLNTVAGEALSEIKDSAITVAGSSNLNAKSVSLDQSGNDFQGTVTSSSTAGSTTLVDKNDLVLNKADSAVNLNVTAGGNLALGNVSSKSDLSAVAGEALSEIKDSAITVAGSSNLKAKSVSLDQSGNDFQGAVVSSSTTGNTSLTDKNAFLLNNVNSQGDLILNSQGDIKQLAGSTIQVRGESTLSGNAIGVGEVGNDFGDGLAIHAKSDASISDQNDLLIRGATVGKNLTLQAKNISQTDAVAVGQSTQIQAQSINLSNLDNQWGTSEVLNSQGDASLAGQNVVLGASTVGGNLQISSNQVAQTGVLSVNGNTLVQASAGDINLQSANELKGALALSGDQVMLRNTLTSHLASLSSKGGKLESDGVLYLEGNVFQGGGDFTFLTHATPAALSSAQIKAMQIPELDAYSGKSAVDPFAGVSDLSIASAGIQQTGGVIQSNVGAHTHFQSTENASIILNRSNQINGLFTALAGSQYGTQYVYSYAKGASLVSVNNLAPLSTDRNGIEADLIAIRSNGLSTLDDSVLRARLPYNDLLVGASQSYPGLLLSIPVDSANRVNNNGLFEFGAQQSGNSTKGAINVEVGNPALPGLGGFTTVLPFQGAVVAPDQLVFLRGPKVNRLYSFYYDGAGNVTRIPVSYNGYIVLSPQESAALTSSQGSVNLARQEQQQSVVRTENVSGQVINGVIMEVGTGRPATEGTGGIAKPATCGSNDADGGC